MCPWFRQAAVNALVQATGPGSACIAKPGTKLREAREASAKGGSAAWISKGRDLELVKLAFFPKFCKSLAGSFSAVSKRNFATKYAFDSIFHALQDLHTSAPLRSQNFRKKSV